MPRIRVAFSSGLRWRFASESHGVFTGIGTQARAILIDISESLRDMAKQVENITPTVVTSRKAIVTSNGIEIQLPPREVDPCRNELYRIIGEGVHEEKDPFEIADYLEDHKYKTLSGEDEWGSGQVEEAIRDIKQNKQIYLVPEIYKLFFE